MSEFTALLRQIEAGDPAARNSLFQLVYGDLRRTAEARMALEQKDHTLQPTALVHEVYLRLADSDSPVSWRDRLHFFAAAAEAMRHILVDHARRKRSQKRGGNWERTVLRDSDFVDFGPSLDILALHEALEKLEARDPRRASLVKLRYFAGMTVAEAAQALDISKSTAEKDFAFARAWLEVELTGQPPE